MNAPENALSSCRLIRFCLSLILLLSVLPVWLEAGLFSRDWPDIFEESNGLDAVQIDPESGAENLIRWVEIEHTETGYSIHTYFYRIKVFNERGVEDLKLIDMEGHFDWDLSRVQGRITYPDGRTLEIDKDSIVRSERFRYDGDSLKKAAFAPPQLDPGCVIDFSWQEKAYPFYGYVLLTRDSRPTHILKFRERFYSQLRPAWSWAGFDGSIFKKERDRFHELSLHNLPALPDEGYLPPFTEKDGMDNNLLFT